MPHVVYFEEPETSEKLRRNNCQLGNVDVEYISSSTMETGVASETSHENIASYLIVLKFSHSAVCL
jgi:hypothetical protein